MKRVNHYKKVVIVHKNNSKMLSTLGSLCAESRTIEGLAKEVKSECIKISAKLPEKPKEGWWRDADAIIRIILAVGLCIAGCYLAKSMNSCSLVELVKRTEKCKESYGELTNNMIVVSRELQMANSAVTELNAEMASVVMVLQTSTNATETLFDRVKVIDERMKCVEWTITNCAPHKLKWCYCPCCW